MQRPTLYGVIHLLPLSASPRFSGSLQQILDAAIFDASQYQQGGFDGIIVENFGDTPFHKECVTPSTVAEITSITTQIQQYLDSKMELGINVLRNDAIAALSIAHAVQADFIRVNVHCGTMYTDQGIIEGNAAESLRLRSSLNSTCKIFADVAVKHASPPPGFDLEHAAQENAYRSCADALIVTGAATGSSVCVDDLSRVKGAVPDRPLLIGSGATAENIATCLQYIDGVIIGSSVKRDGQLSAPVCLDRVREFAQKVTA